MKSLVDEHIRINPKTGFYEPIWWKASMLPYQLTFDPQYVSNGLLTIASTGNTIAVFKEPHTSNGLDQGFGSPLLIKHTTFEDSTDGTSSAAFSIMLKDLGDTTQFMNQPIHILNFSGTGQLPAELSEPLFLPTLHTLQATYAKISGGNTTMRQYFNGKLFMPWDTSLLDYPQDRATMIQLLKKLTERRKAIFPFWFTTDQTVTIPANGTFEVDTDVGMDGHFEITHLIGTSTGIYNLNILNPETKQSFTNGQVASASAVGTAQNPQRLGTPWLIPAGKRLRFQFTDTSGSSNNVFICLRGRRVRADLKTGDDVKKLQQTVSQVKRDLRIPQRMAV